MASQQTRAKWIENEFLATMRAKGKFERPMNEARERKFQEQYGTTDRVFPSRTAPPPAALGNRNKDKKKSKVVSAERAQLKVAMKRLEERLESERAARGQMEAEYNELIIVYIMERPTPEFTQWDET
eukprot:CAMPEP_0118935460 /NCGR_PEP_ID=MMETSP1169-20130426/15656_1 /TAXON_ID=36882 /ORGANISM="Pyramimonas obovata, Strain CCMP722" /LENGTH=126 /DNA_ID=CAMNT_0006878503 /DNA_START=166 /DNA_END=547 /DNA_ORIENTATION=-